MKISKASKSVLFIMTMGTSLLYAPLNAANITSTEFTITGVLEAKTCSFNETTLTVDLPDVDTRSLNNTNIIQGKTDFTLSMNCSGGVSSINIIPSGSAVTIGDSTLFLNTNSARNVGLRLLDKDGNTLTPDGQKKISINYDESGGKYMFSAGYAPTGSGRVSGGSFKTVVTFALDYS